MPPGLVVGSNGRHEATGLSQCLIVGNRETSFSATDVRRGPRPETVQIEGGGESAVPRREGNHDDIEFSTLQHPSQVLCEIFFQFERHFGYTCAQQ